MTDRLGVIVGPAWVEEFHLPEDSQHVTKPEAEDEGGRDEPEQGQTHSDVG